MMRDDLTELIRLFSPHRWACLLVVLALAVAAIARAAA